MGCFIQASSFATKRAANYANFSSDYTIWRGKVDGGLQMYIHYDRNHLFGNKI